MYSVLVRNEGPSFPNLDQSLRNAWYYIRLGVESEKYYSPYYMPPVGAISPT